VIFQATKIILKIPFENDRRMNKQHLISISFWARKFRVLGPEKGILHVVPYLTARWHCSETFFPFFVTLWRAIIFISTF
jgi:hypothetical protein